VVLRSCVFFLVTICVLTLPGCLVPRKTVSECACFGDVETTRELLKYYVDVNARGYRGYTALVNAEGCYIGSENATRREEITKLLLQHGADPNLATDDGTTALMYAARNGNASVIRRLLRAGATVNARNKEGMTALMFASRTFCNPEAVQLLINAGANLDDREERGLTALDVLDRSYACRDSPTRALLVSGKAQ
jgi:hypothetical protein